EQLMQALDYQKENKGKRIGNVMIELGFINESQMLDALARRLGLEHVSISSVRVKVESVERIPMQLSQQYGILAVDENDDHNILKVLTNDPLNFYGLEDVRQVTGMELDILLAEEKPLQSAIQYYYSEVSAKKAAKTANADAAPQVEELDVEEGDGDTPIINLLNSLVQRAYSTNASDIHIEPFEKQSVVRMRIDGVIVDYVTLQKAIHPSLIARIKIISDLDIAERRIPQDGHFRMHVGDAMVNIRVSMIPTVFGEKAVLRILASSGIIDNSGTYGMNEDSYQKFSKILAAPYGIIYITGPTGSGKTTTLYMVLDQLAQKQVNISTIEDPVEKNLPRVNQMQVNNQAGLTFEIGLRALLRQDPDVIMVGETRDAQTAGISIRAAITGHQVLSTLHTNNAAATIVRLVDMGMEPYMIASSLTGVVAQRLMRKTCPNCSVVEAPTPEERVYLDPDITQVRHARGCNHCNYTGYSGRVAIHEILMMDDVVREMVTRKASTEEIADYAVAHQHMVTLKEASMDLVRRGVTSPEELRKVAYFS
ncbi:MAG: ATPase, T2SS/T4P/T4SS family, partial [Eubacteriales bacterium]|nr:ATPase, T2SS/T4P/T4SS family [Eubacteriales bacterium]